MKDNTHFNIGKVTALRSVRQKIDELNGTLKSLSCPVIDDFALLPRLYEAYLNVFARRGSPDAALRVYNRKKFLLIVLYLYCPAALSGERMKAGLRSKLSALFGLTASTPISDNCTDLLFTYQNFRDFRRDVDIIYKEIADVILSESNGKEIPCKNG